MRGCKRTLGPTVSESQSAPDEVTRFRSRVWPKQRVTPLPRGGEGDSSAAVADMVRANQFTTPPVVHRRALRLLRPPEAERGQAVHRRQGLPVQRGVRAGPVRRGQDHPAHGRQPGARRRRRQALMARSCCHPRLDQPVEERIYLDAGGKPQLSLANDYASWLQEPPPTVAHTRSRLACESPGLGHACSGAGAPLPSRQQGQQRLHSH